jgi:sulfur-oxidizing protein SoxY
MTSADSAAGNPGGDPPTVSRRTLMIASGAMLAKAMLPGTAAHATPEAMAATLRSIIGSQTAKVGRIKLEIPELAENGNSVPLTITVQSPMTAADHVKSIFIISPENPLPDVARFHLSPLSGRARVSTSVRLATSQQLHVVALMADGSAWTAAADIIVTMSACIDSG